MLEAVDRLRLPALDGDLDDHHQDAAGDEGDGDRRGSEEQRLDLLAEEEPGDRGRHEAEQQRDEQRHALLLGRHETGGALPEQAAVLDDDGEDRAELDHDVERVGALTFQAEQAAREDEMARRRDGQVLGDALDDTEDRRVERIQEALAA